MTGFGKATGQLASKKISIQLKSLNSKQADITVKVPLLFKSQELNIQKQLSNALERGKMELLLTYESAEEKGNYQIDRSLFKDYHTQLEAAQKEVGISSPDLTSLIVKMPDVLKSTEEELNEDDGKKLEEVVHSAITALMQFRAAEGNNLAADLSQRIHNILALLEEALQFEEERTEVVRNRLQLKLEELDQKGKLDADRFEQELIYYMEKFDISEEKVRLRSHCEYFIETMEEKPGQGKKLGFISQEIGREVNTLGSKANHAEMQKVVVQMKEQLEKIKEQVLNVL
jgi:uncharacterized protein (TIGR00255 family)